MTLFALLHGGMHRGSCWDAVSAELHRGGHAAIAPDLPVEDDAAGAHEWAQGVVDAIDTAVGAVDTDVVVVGHSLSGLCLPSIATLRSIRHMVFVAGLLPVPGRSFVEHLATEPEAITFPSPAPGGTAPMGLTWESVRAGFYHDCPESVAREAFDHMRRQSFTPFVETCPVERWPQTPATYILMRDDRAVSTSWVRWHAVHRIGATVLELDGGHSPFFAQPVRLARALIAASG